MPYVDRDTRERLLEPHAIAENVGELTYLLTLNLASYLDERLNNPEGLRYQDLAECLGALEGAKADFIERLLTTYERRKRGENGDVWGAAVVDYARRGERRPTYGP